ncbi:MAG: xanthine dehydrogenase family protein subunit M [Pseudorhodobacter sp.]|nr:xanthine dehydrogenase family protein subunit M [Pseudorhodobacter sp.]
MYADFDLIAPNSLQEALDALGSDKTGAVPLAGGTNVLLDVRSRRIAPEHLLDLSRIGGLRGITVADGRVSLGARTTVSDLMASPEIARIAPALAEAARIFAGQMVRNAATVAGNVACGSPAADLVPPLLSLDAEVALTSLRGTRQLALADYYLGYKSDRREPDELITAISWPVPTPNTHGGFYKLARRKGDAITVVGVAVSIGVGATGCEWARIALGSVGPTPVRAIRAENLLLGGPLTQDKIAAAARAAAEDCSPIDDVRATGDYRRHMVSVLVARMVNRAVEANS